MLHEHVQWVGTFPAEAEVYETEQATTACTLIIPPIGKKCARIIAAIHRLIPKHLAVDHGTRGGIAIKEGADRTVSVDEYDPRQIFRLDPSRPSTFFLRLRISTDADVAHFLSPPSY